MTDANSQTASMVYNVDGQATSLTDKNGRVINLSYDHDARLTQEQWEQKRCQWTKRGQSTFLKK